VQTNYLSLILQATAVAILEQGLMNEERFGAVVLGKNYSPLIYTLDVCWWMYVGVLCVLRGWFCFCQRLCGVLMLWFSFVFGFCRVLGCVVVVA
jgi:hypothetical protein